MEKETEENKSWLEDTLGVRAYRFFTGPNRSKGFKLTLLLIPFLFVLVIILILLFGK